MEAERKWVLVRGIDRCQHPLEVWCTPLGDHCWMVPVEVPEWYGDLRTQAHTDFTGDHTIWPHFQSNSDPSYQRLAIYGSEQKAWQGLIDLRREQVSKAYRDLSACDRQLMNDQDRAKAAGFKPQ